MNDEIKSFQTLWKGGYYEGNPLDPTGRSNYVHHDLNHGYLDQIALAAERGIKAKQFAYLSTLYVAYITCLKARVRDRVVLEIGPGRGAWSKVILEEGARHLYALDVLSAEHNGFFDYADPEGTFRDKVTYLQVDDFSCTLPAGVNVDFFFSFGCFCHISRSGTEEYFKNIFKVMSRGAEGFILISDYAKIERALGRSTDAVDFPEDTTPSPGRWYHLGTDWFCRMISDIGFVVQDRDVGCNVRDPIVHFVRP